MNAERKSRRRYASDPQVERMVALARRCGIDVAGLEVSPDGAIRIMEARSVAQQPTDFDRFADQL